MNIFLRIKLSLIALLLMGAAFSPTASAKMICGTETTPTCEAVPAEFVRNVGSGETCALQGAFLDVGRGECWKCPAGAHRTGNSVTDPKTACIKPRAGRAEYVRATKLTQGSLWDCPAGSVYDPRNGGECWACPTAQGFERSKAPVNEWNACYKAHDFKPAKLYGKPPLNCPPGQKGDVNGHCYSCPAGYTKTVFSSTGPTACEKVVTQPVSRKSGTFTRWATGWFKTDCPAGEKSGADARCYVCPPGHAFTMALPYNWNGCIRHARTDVHHARTIDHGFLKKTCGHGQQQDISRECFTCPAGYDRVLVKGIHDSTVCEKAVKQYSRAKLTRGGCDVKKGQFLDVTKAQCWTCPNGYERSLVYPVDSAKACNNVLGTVSHAEFAGYVGCQVEKDEIWDIYKKPGSHKPGDSIGSCWKCPKQTQRGGGAVYSQQACDSNIVRWKADPYNEPGLAGMYLGRLKQPYLDLISQWFESKEAIAGINDYLSLAAAENGHTSAAAIDGYIKKEWNKIAKEPLKNTSINAYTFIALMQALRVAEAKRTELQKDMITVFENYIKQRKIFVAQQAQKAYDQWREAVVWKQARKSKTGGNTEILFGDDFPGPDFGEIAQEALKSNEATAPLVVAMTTYSLADAATGGKIAERFDFHIFPNRNLEGDNLDPNHKFARNIQKKANKRFGKNFADDALKNAVNSGDEVASATKKAITQVDDAAKALAKQMSGAADDIAKGLFNKAMIKSSKVIANLSKSMGAIGPQIVIAAATFVFETRLDQIIEMNDAPLKLKAALGEAKRDKPDLDVILTQDGGMQTLMKFWSLATEGTSTSSQGLIKAAKKAAALAQEGNYSQEGILALEYTGSGTKKVKIKDHIIVQGNGDNIVFAGGGSVGASASTSTVQQAASPEKMKPVNWKLMPGGLSDIAVNAKGDTWGIGNKPYGAGSNIYHLQNKRWQKQAGSAKHVAVAPSGEAWVVNDKGEIFRGNGKRWQNVPGKAKTIAIGAQGDVWMLSFDPHAKGKQNHNIFKWDEKKKKWNRYPGNAIDIAVAANGLAWVVNSQGDMFQQDKKSWKKIPGVASAVVTGGDGSIWYLSKATAGQGGKAIYRSNDQGKTWHKVAGQLTDIAVVGINHVSGVNAFGKVYTSK